MNFGFRVSNFGFNLQVFSVTPSRRLPDAERLSRAAGLCGRSTHGSHPRGTESSIWHAVCCINRIRSNQDIGPVRPLGGCHPSAPADGTHRTGFHSCRATYCGRCMAVGPVSIMRKEPGTERDFHRQFCLWFRQHHRMLSRADCMEVSLFSAC